MENKNTDLSSLRINKSDRNLPAGSRKKIVAVIFTIIILVIIYVGYNVYNTLLNPPVEVNLVTAAYQSPANASAIFTASGYVVAQRKAAVASKGTGRLVYLGVVEGDKVKKGEIIARLQDNDVKAQLAEAKANLELQEASRKSVEDTYRRQAALLKTGSTTQAEVDAAQANYKKLLASIDLARAQVQAAEVAVENTLIRAPFDGTVLTKDADVGEIVAPLAGGINSRGAVVTIADMRSLQVEADVAESNIERVTPDQDCEITLDAYPNHVYPGYVAKIVPTADRTKATVMVKIGFKKYDSRVLPEMSAKVLFLSKQENAGTKQQRVLTVPSTAVKNISGRNYVFIVKNNKAAEVQVITGRQFNSYVEIKSGLISGDKVIENAADKIKDGVIVKVQQP